MKKIYLLIAVCLLVITFGCEIGANHQSISVLIKEGTYSFKAEYPKYKTRSVLNYLKEKIRKDGFFNDDEGMKDEDVTLSDSSRFHLTSEPGYVKIDFKKRNNSVASY